ncbi:hypothetical protein N7466_009928 [Penicillium verhagenii]|uniref:uncharacterized protein n=1 Tax=Penicillium verhagenii TaxID=1562060 RepID=UPI002545BBC2|nr:uncharacterized protein N7466_009928 [Penicillium verhagenii]KAJ5918985.1 hypothetical protein N7466_009928 [Penicillium verhagenii]
MAAVMTQTECAPGTRSPGSLLKLGSPGDGAEAEVSRTGLNVFEMSPDTALQLLCNNLENLQAHFAKTSTEPNSFSSTPAEGEILTDGDSSLQAVGLHCGDSEHAADRTREETFQLALLARKFLSKKVPPIPIRDYLLRLHQYCPMSTAVFLATSVYITKMALVEKVLRVTPKNMHRLVLAGLLVATKALEDLSFPHSRVAKVGGVSEQELSKLEISFCFLANFELRVDEKIMMDEIQLRCNRDSSNDDTGSAS